MATLWLTISLTALFNAPQTCAFEPTSTDDSPPSDFCSALVWADTILWAVCTGLNGVACCGSWFMIQHIIAMDEGMLPQWLIRNVKIFMCPVLCIVSSTFVLSAAIITRIMVISQNETRGFVAAAIITVLNMGGTWLLWFQSAKSVYCFPWRDVISFHIGVWGFVSQGKFKKQFPGTHLDLGGPKGVSSH